MNLSPLTGEARSLRRDRSRRLPRRLPAGFPGKGPPPAGMKSNGFLNVKQQRNDQDLPDLRA